jgi:subtilase family serine protease
MGAKVGLLCKYFKGKIMKTKMLLFALVASAGTILIPPSSKAQQTLHGQVPGAIARLHLQPIGRLPETNRLNLAIELPLRNKEALNSLLQQIYDPRSTNYHHYLTPKQFTEQFGPTEADYEAVVAFAKTNGWTVTGRDPGLTIVDVSATVADVERVCHVKMLVYRHPAEARTFFAPDNEPSLDLKTPVLDISGMNNYVLPHPASLRQCSREGSGFQGRDGAGVGIAR